MEPKQNSWFLNVANSLRALAIYKTSNQDCKITWRTCSASEAWTSTKTKIESLTIFPTLWSTRWFLKKWERLIVRWRTAREKMEMEMVGVLISAIKRKELWGIRIFWTRIGGISSSSEEGWPNLRQRVQGNKKWRQQLKRRDRKSKSPHSTTFSFWKTKILNSSWSSRSSIMSCDAIITSIYSAV